MKAKPLPSLEYLNECFELDKSGPSGLRWKKRPLTHFNKARGCNIFNSKMVGKVAGTIQTDVRGRQHWQVVILRSKYKLHRIVYSMLKQELIPCDIDIDHRDLNPLNNNESNLRLATRSQNSCNTRKQRNNTSGFKGVTYSATGKYWWGAVWYNKQRHTICGCPTPEKANELLQELRERLHKEFHNHGE